MRTAPTVVPRPFDRTTALLAPVTELMPDPGTEQGAGSSVSANADAIVLGAPHAFSAGPQSKAPPKIKSAHVRKGSLGAAKASTHFDDKSSDPTGAMCR